jgi:protein required for attachment to host cells
MKVMHWVVVADASTAVIYRADDTFDEFEAVQSMEHPEGRMKGRELYSDGPGKTAGGGVHSATSDHAAQRDAEDDRFARSVAGQLDHGLPQYERLILVAPPRFLGRLRSAIGKTTKRAVVATIDKDLVSVPIHDLPAVLRKTLPETTGLPSHS